ncbi:MAG: hypothetical protein ACW98I_17440, partial [Candidatus Hodarchaeales archaeon]
MTKDHTYSYRVNKTQMDKDVKLAKDKGMNTFAKFLDSLRETYNRNPDILEVTENVQSAEILESLENSFSVFDDLTAYLKDLSSQVEKLQRFQEWMVKKL